MAFTHLDPSTAVNATVTNGNLTVTATGSSSGCFGLASDALSAGKFYFEVDLVSAAAGNECWGIAFSGATFTGLGTSGADGAINYDGFSGEIFVNSSHTNNTGFTGAANDIRAVAIDFTNNLIWFKDLTNSGSWNGSGTADPATGAGGLAIPSGKSWFPAGVTDTGTQSMTFNFGASAFTGAVPSGFTSGWPSSAVTAFPYTQSKVIT